MSRFVAVLGIAALAACSRSRQDANNGGATTQGPTTQAAAIPATQPPVNSSPKGTGGTATRAPVGPTADTAVGRVAEVGPDPATWMALTPPGGTQIRLRGQGGEEMRAVTGAMVWVRGTRDAAGFRVDAFEVRQVNDQPVDDGVIVVTAGGVAVRMQSGVQREVPNAPRSMREMPGTRIWVSRPVSGVAPSFGVIRRP